MDQRLKIMPGDDDGQLDEMDAAIEQALGNDQSAARTIAEATPQPDPEQPTTVRTLIKRSKGSFIKNIEQLEQQVRAVNRAVLQSQREKHDLIVAAEARHRAFEQEAEKDLYQIKTVMAAIELAMSVMPDE